MLRNDKLWIVFLVILLAGGCAKKETPNDEIPYEELVPESEAVHYSLPVIPETSTDNSALPLMVNFVDENYLSRRNELIELIKKVPYPDEPEQIILWLLNQMGSFLVLGRVHTRKE
jgi:hypothetical protein